jgi:hypothetical protein
MSRIVIIIIIYHRHKPTGLFPHISSHVCQRPATIPFLHVLPPRSLHVLLPHACYVPCSGHPPF